MWVIDFKVRPRVRSGVLAVDESSIERSILDWIHCPVAGDRDAVTQEDVDVVEAHTPSANDIDALDALWS